MEVIAKWTSPHRGLQCFMLVSSALVLVMTPGLAFFYGGMVRSKAFDMSHDEHPARWVVVTVLERATCTRLRSVMTL